MSAVGIGGFDLAKNTAFAGTAAREKQERLPAGHLTYESQLTLNGQVNPRGYSLRYGSLGLPDWPGAGRRAAVMVRPDSLRRFRLGIPPRVNHIAFDPASQAEASAGAEWRHTNHFQQGAKDQILRGKGAGACAGNRHLTVQPLASRIRALAMTIETFTTYIFRCRDDSARLTRPGQKSGIGQLEALRAASIHGRVARRMAGHLDDVGGGIRVHGI